MSAPTRTTRVDGKVAEVSERARAALLRHGAGVDPAEPSELLAELAELCAEMHEQLRGPRPLGAARTADVCEGLAALVTLQGDLREHVIGLRFDALARIHEALGRLRAVTSVEALMPAAGAELGSACGFDRTVISRLSGSTWRAESVWMREGLDATMSEETRSYLLQTWHTLTPQTLEGDLVRRRGADLVAVGDPRADPRLMEASRSRGYVAAPVMPTGRVIGFLQADCVDRDVTALDRDNLWTFAEGFGLVFEHLVLLERVEEQRARVRDAFQAAERRLAALAGDERMLRRREQTGNAPVGALLGSRVGGMSSGALDRLLSAREREVLDLMVTGARNAEIADRLVIAEATVKSHVHTIRRKLHASSRADAVSRYLRLNTRQQR